MMQGMILFQPLPQPIVHGQMVGGVMYHIVANISENESGEKRRQFCRAGQCPEEIVENKGERYAHHWRHDQPRGITWIIVMYAVKYKVYPFAELRRRLIVKYETVQQVLCQRPHQRAR